MLRYALSSRLLPALLPLTLVLTTACHHHVEAQTPGEIEEYSEEPPEEEAEAAEEEPATDVEPGLDDPAPTPAGGGHDKARHKHAAQARPTLPSEEPEDEPSEELDE